MASAERMSKQKAHKNESSGGASPASMKYEHAWRRGVVLHYHFVFAGGDTVIDNEVTSASKS